MTVLILPNLRKKIYISIFFSGMGILLMSAGLVLISRVWGFSVLLGGVFWVILQGFCAIKLFHRIEAKPQKFMIKFYQSEILKLLVIGILFISAVNWLSASLGGLFAGYFCGQILFWFLMFFYLNFNRRVVNEFR